MRHLNERKDGKTAERMDNNQTHIELGNKWYGDSQH